MDARARGKKERAEDVAADSGPADGTCGPGPRHGAAE